MKLVRIVDENGLFICDDFVDVLTDRTIETPCPSGFVLPKWNGAQWIEGGTILEEILANQIRAERNRLLAETDWTQLSDSPLTAEQIEAYRVYRQALRDITEQEGFPLGVAWPVILN